MRLLIALFLVSGCASSGLESGATRASSEIRQFGASGPTLNYLILGDSTAVGVGGDYEQGIAVSTARHLARSRSVRMKNLAVSGAQMAGVLHDQLDRTGDFRPDLVLLDVGANDVTHLTSAGSLERDLRKVVEQLIGMNCEVKIVVTGAPDMSTPPRIPWILRGIAGWRTRSLNQAFERVVKERRLTLAPIAEETGPLFKSDPTLFSEDRFHPDERGYQTWIEVINPALERALSSQPGHCEE